MTPNSLTVQTPKSALGFPNLREKPAEFHTRQRRIGLRNAAHRLLYKLVNEITRLLQAFRNGQPDAAQLLIPHVYEQLRRMAVAQMARERPGNTLQPTALVHEAWLRLVNAGIKTDFKDRTHFFCVASEAMRCLLVDSARRRLAARHGGGQVREDLDAIEIAAPDADERMLAVHEALERFTLVDQEKAEVVKLRYFAGMSVEESAEALGVSERTIRRHWDFARAWLFTAIKKDGQV